MMVNIAHNKTAAVVGFAAIRLGDECASYPGRETWGKPGDRRDVPRLSPPDLGIVDVPHHVTQRGNARQVILASDADRVTYLELLQEYS